MYETDKREMTDGKEKRPMEKEEKEGRRDKNEERKRRMQEDANGKETRYEVICDWMRESSSRAPTVWPLIQNRISKSRRTRERESDCTDRRRRIISCTMKN